MNYNEKVLKDSFIKLSKNTDDKFNQLFTEIEMINMLNEQIKVIQRGIDESEHSFELLVDTLVHAEQGTLQPQVITIEKIRNIMMKQNLPSGLDYPALPFSEFQKIVTPHTYSYNQYLVYVLDVPLLTPTIYHLYKMMPFPTENSNQYAFVNPSKDLIFSDSLRQHFGKMTLNELTSCYSPNSLQYVCQENIPIYTYVPGLDCESTVLHPSTESFPKNCEIRLTHLTKTLWIPLHLSNQWLYVSPKPETMTTLCGNENKKLIIEKKGKLTLNSNCKAFTTYVTLYAMTTKTTNNTEDYIPNINLNMDCCLPNHINDYSKISLDVPLVNVLSSADDLRFASIKADEVSELIKEQEKTNYPTWLIHISSIGAIVSTVLLLILLLRCFCCCCKTCRQCFFWMWNKWTPRKCWEETRTHLCQTNVYNAKVIYTQNAENPKEMKPLTGSHPSPILHQSKKSPSLTLPKDEDKDESIARRTRSRSDQNVNKLFR